MTKQASGFLRRNKVKAANILYLSRENGKTVATMKDGSRLETYIPLKAIVEELPENSFQLINKGIALNSRHISNISGRTFTMRDGAEFEGRLRGSVLTSPQSVAAPRVARERRGISSRFAVLDNMQIGFCVLSLASGPADKPLVSRFTFCYCNEALADMLATSTSDILGCRLSDVIELDTGSPVKRAVDSALLSEMDSRAEVLASVAETGEGRTMSLRLGAEGQTLAAYCFQPQAGYVACGLCLV